MSRLKVFLTILIFLNCLQARISAANLSSSGSATHDSPNDSSVKVSAETTDQVSLPPEKTKPVKITKIEASPLIDGRIDEQIWKQAAVFKDFYQTYPGDNIEPSKPTEVYMMYDEKNIYIAFKCFDERGAIRATVAKRDQILSEDRVWFWLDTFNDRRRAYVFVLNPLGIQQDGIYTEGQGPDFTVDVVFESKGVIEDWGWSVEAKIPFKSLRYSAGKGKLWGFNAARTITRLNDEFDYWLPNDRNVSGFLVKHGKITGFDEIKTERTLEITPNITISETGSRRRTFSISSLNDRGFDPILNPTGIQDPGRFLNAPVRPQLGVNLKYTITPNVTLDAAINPDFAEIEADAPVITANQRFPIFFDEKRPFFLENKDIFNSPLQPFYSRTIIDPDFAAKLTGKIGKTSFGFLAASDNAPGNYSEDERNDAQIRPQIDEFLDKNAFFSVLRVKRDLGANNNIGFLGTTRIFPGSRNVVGGFDGTFKLNPSTLMTFQFLGIHSRKDFYNPDTDSSEYRAGNGFGYFWNLSFNKERRGYRLEASGRTNDYRADAGFTRRTNTNNLLFSNRLTTKSNPKGTLIRANWLQFANLSYDWNGHSQGGEVGTNVNFFLKGNLFSYVEVGVDYERLFEKEFGAKRNASRTGAFFGAAERSAYQPYISLHLYKTFSKQLTAYATANSTWNSFDLDFGAGRFLRESPAYLDWLERYRRNPNTAGDSPALDPGTGHQFYINLSGEYKPVDPFSISLDYTKSSLRRNDTQQRTFETNIFSLKSTYQFSRFTFIRTRLDYDNLSRNAGGQLIFGWNPNPGTAFYVGYNDSFSYNGLNPYTRQFEPGFERGSRTFFIRASYLFRKSF